MENTLILEDLKSHLDGRITREGLVLEILRQHNQIEDIYIEIRHCNINGYEDGIPRLWVWTDTEDEPSLVTELNDPKSIQKVIKHTRYYIKWGTNVSDISRSK